MGGLGNQLFQIFTTISYAMKQKKSFGFLYSEYVGVGKTICRKTYWNTFLKGIKKYVFLSLPHMKYFYEEDFHYKELPEPIELNICLFGYFQSYKYFEKYTNLILRLLNIKMLKENVREKSGFLKNDFETIASMHFRLGDYKFISDIYPLLTCDYYDESLKLLLNNNNKINKVLYFCEEQDINDVLPIINKLKIKYSSLEFIKVTQTLDDWEELLLMSCCKYNIIANSTFSWWAAYLNTNENKIVFYPEHWFGARKSSLNTNDLFLPNWHKVYLINTN
jgi:hypothetical protein